MSTRPLVQPEDDPAGRRQRLLALLRRKAMIAGREMRLASGRTSDVYFDMKPAMLDPEGIDLIADSVLDLLDDENVELIGGLEMGAVPIIGAVAGKSVHRRPVAGFFVRKTVKEHGTQKKIEGNFDPAKPIALLEDVTTTGGSVLQAARAVRAQGGTVALVLTIVDREEGAAAALASEGIRLRALFTRSDFR
jgi:orotate phosphoribosyltransferase